MTSRTFHETPATSHFNFVYGRYQLWNWKIPYFSTTMNLREAADSLKLVSEFPGAENINWEIEELYQREVDWARVENGIRPYLLDDNNPQFFNALTVALLPMTESGQFQKSFNEYDDDRFDAPAIGNPSIADINTRQIGPITFGYWDEWASIDEPGAEIGQMRWNPDQVFSVAIDGQHRLAAIKSIVESNRIFPDRLTSTSIPVILLIFDERLGFSAPADANPVSVMRRVFVDLNKHAKPVSRARRILLDDLDPIALCTRSVIGNKLANGLEDLQGHRIPLTLMDWQSEQAKFNDGPYLTTILGLEWMVSKIMGISTIDDWTDYSRVRSQVRQLQRSTGADLSQALTRLEGLENDSAGNVRPFHYLTTPHNNELDRITESFAKNWNPRLIALLTKFNPYNALIELRNHQGSLNIQIANWFAAYTRAESNAGARVKSEYAEITDRLANRSESPWTEMQLKELITEMNELKEDKLAFTVVFQRAYVLALLGYMRMELPDDAQDQYSDFDITSDEKSFDGEEDEHAVTEDSEPDLDHTDAFIRAMNQLDETIPGLWAHRFSIRHEDENKRFWLGTFARPEGPIDFTQGASGRASDLLLCATAIATALQSVPSGRYTDYEALLNQFREEAQDSTNAIGARYLAAFNRLTKDETSAGGRILTTYDDDFDIDRARNEMHDRLQYIFERLAE